MAFALNEEDKTAPFQWAIDYIKNNEDTERWLIEKLIPAEGLVNFYGKPKTGKSFAAYGVALAVSEGHAEWMGYAVKTHGPVMIVQIDTPRGENVDRFKRLHNLGFDISKIAVVDMKMAPYPFNVLDKKHFAYLRQQIAAVKPVLIIIDTLREAHDKDENDSTAMKLVVNQIVSLARSTTEVGAAVILISHARKDSAMNVQGAESDLMDAGRGSSYVSGRMDTIFHFTGKGEPMKGHMKFRGRSVPETKIPIVQDPESLLVFRDGQHAKQEQGVLGVLRDEQQFLHNGKPSVNAMAKHLVDAKVFNSVATAARQIEKTREKLRIEAANVLRTDVNADPE